MTLLIRCLLIAVILCSVHGTVSAQTAPIGSAAPGDVLRPGHLGRQIGDLERIIHFYHDLLGTDIQGERDAPHPFFASPGLTEFANTPAHGEYRAVILPIPGTAPEPNSGLEMAIEAIEFRNFERHQYVHDLPDVGGSHLVLLLRDLDSAMERLTEAGVPVISVGGAPLEVPLLYGSGMRKRAVIVRDPDGYPVELVELTPAPATTAPDDSNIIGARISLTVSDLDTTQALYRDLMGRGAQFWSSSEFIRDGAYNRLRNTPGAEYRFAAALIPGSAVALEFIEYRSIPRYSIAPTIQDIGGGHVLFMIDDMDLFMSRIRAAGLKPLATSGEPVFIGPTVQAVFVTDNDNFFVEFMARMPE